MLNDKYGTLPSELPSLSLISSAPLSTFTVRCTPRSAPQETAQSWKRHSYTAEQLCTHGSSRRLSLLVEGPQLQTPHTFCTITSFSPHSTTHSSSSTLLLLVPFRLLAASPLNLPEAASQQVCRKVQTPLYPASSHSSPQKLCVFPGTHRNRNTSILYFSSAEQSSANA